MSARRQRPTALLIDFDGVLRGADDDAAFVPEVLDVVADLRAAGISVVLCADGTDDLAAVAAAFDAVVSSSEVGVAKPHPDFFAAACGAVATSPERCLFVDDVVRDVAGARAAGLSAIRYTGPADLPYIRAAFTPR